jgi:hypothetical protein
MPWRSWRRPDLDVNARAVAGRRSYLLFACHSAANWFEPNYSTLVLAGPEMVVAGELANLNLDAARLGGR